jgi:transcriptional regulator of met regulon
MTVEQIAIRQEVRQLMNEAGINKNTMQDIVREVISEEMTKAVRQVMHEMDIDTIIRNKATGSLQDSIRKELRDSIDQRVKSVFSRMIISVDVTDSTGTSSITR